MAELGPKLPWLEENVFGSENGRCALCFQSSWSVDREKKILLDGGSEKELTIVY